MLIPLGFLASSGAKAAGSFDLLATTLVSSSVTSVTFDTSTYAALGYKHLQIRMTSRQSTNSNETKLRFNSDSGSNYSHHILDGNGSTVASIQAAASQSQIFWYGTGASGDVANLFAGGIVDILDPFNTSKNKTVRNFSGFSGTYKTVELSSGAWYNTSAVTSVTLSCNGSFVSGSRFSIYGLKG